MQEKLSQIMSKNFKVPLEQITDQAKVETIESWGRQKEAELMQI